MLDQLEPLDEGDAIEAARPRRRARASAPGSPVGQRVLDDWDALLPKFVKVFPTDYKRVLAEQRAAEAARQAGRSSTGGEGFVIEESAMGELGGFLKIERSGVAYDDPTSAIEGDDLQGVPRPRARTPSSRAQGARCMECGVPFCHNGCPLGNLIPDWNDLVYRDRWHDAILQLHATNNFPEFTGRLCPAPCEAACVLEINEGDAVTIKQIENAIIDRAWDEGWVVPAAAAARDRPQRRRRRRRPGRAWPPRSSCAAPATASSLFERDEAAGGLVRFGVPDFKIEKRVVERRVEQLRERGRRACAAASTSASTSPATSCAREFDAVVLAIGSRVPRDLPVPGRELDGVHFAMDYLYVRNRAVATAGREPTARDHAPRASTSSSSAAATPARTASGNSIREGAASVVAARAAARAARAPPRRPHAVAAVAAEVPPLLRDGGGAGRSARGEQDFSVVDDALRAATTGACTTLHFAQAERRAAVRAGRGHRGRAQRRPRAARDGLPAPRAGGRGRPARRRARTSAATSRRATYATSVPGVFAAGDARRGQSLIVWAINEGRQCARMVDRYLTALDDGTGRADDGRRGRRRGRGARRPAARGVAGALSGRDGVAASRSGSPVRR